MEITVEWQAKPTTGLTGIDITELGVKTLREWYNLSKSDQEQRINSWLKDNEEEIVAKATCWYNDQH